MQKTTQTKNFNMINGLGTISFSSELIANIIKKVLSSFPKYEYVSYSIEPFQDNYYEVSIQVKKLDAEINFKEIDRLQKELLIVLKQSLNLTCIVALNISNGK